MEEGEVKRKRKITLAASKAKRAEFRSKTREEINKMRIPGVPYLPPPPDPNLFDKGNHLECNSHFQILIFNHRQIQKPSSFKLQTTDTETKRDPGNHQKASHQQQGKGIKEKVWKYKSSANLHRSRTCVPTRALYCTT